MEVCSFGCSFVFGTELRDAGEEDEQNRTPSQLTWPALVANKLGLPYHSRARGGSGNVQILERLLNEVSVHRNSYYYIITWSWIDRFDYQNDSSNLGWTSTITPTNTDSFSTRYYKNYHSEFRDKLITLSCIQTAVAMLQAAKAPFFMTCLDDLTFDQSYRQLPGTVLLQNSTQPWTNTFDGTTFLKWSQQQGFAHGPDGHPLESAHAKAAELIFPEVSARLKNHQAQQGLLPGHSFV